MTYHCAPDAVVRRVGHRWVSAAPCQGPPKVLYVVVGDRRGKASVGVNGMVASIVPVYAAATAWARLQQSAHQHIARRWCHAAIARGGAGDASVWGACPPEAGAL